MRILPVLFFVASAAIQAQTLTAPDIEAFLDGVMPLQLRREDVAGAVIVVVKDGKVLFEKGYGYSDVAKRTAVSPDSTLFRPGSISKLFTWTAVMQLVEERRLDLDRDINEYIDFKIPATFPQPITLRNVMTHTPGFEETLKELFLPSEKDLTSLGDYLKKHLPQRVFPPGTVPAYSNYATALAGYIVQRVSGEPYDNYIEAHILQPLGMLHTTFRQPLPDGLKPLMSNGYTVASKPPKPYEVVQAWPAGSCSITGSDIARFMIAHLNDGEFENARILQPETARLMHSRQFENLPQLNGMALGFYEETRNGHRIIGHGGDTIYFHSDLHLMPDSGLGFFVSYNSAGKGQINPRSAVWEAFLDRYFPYKPPAASSFNSSDDQRLVAGNYLVSRRSHTNLLSVLTVAGELKVSANPDGTINAGERDLNGEQKHFREIGPLLFREENGQSLVGFKRDSSGRLTMAMDFPFMVFQKASWDQDGTLNLSVIGVSLSVLALTLLLWPVAALVRLHYGQKLALTPAQRTWRLAVRIGAIACVAFAVAWAVLLMTLSSDIGKLNASLDGTLHLVQIAGCLGVIGTLPALVAAYKSWTAPNWWWTRIHSLGVALAFAGFTWFVWNWHMLHWSLNY